MENKRILVLCGGRFALPALQTLAIEKFLCGIAIGKGEKQVTETLRQESERSGLAFRSFPDKESISELSAWIAEVDPDYIFSISFPFLIPAAALDFGREKFVNFHPGPLPSYRGPMPVFEVLRYGEKETAVSVHLMNDEFDEGPVILREQVRIGDTDTYGSLAVKLSERTAHTAMNVAQMLQFASVIPSEEQDGSNGRYFEKPEPEDTFIRWDRMPAEEILSLIRACNPWNQGADTVLLGESVKLVSASLSPVTHETQPGTPLAFSENQGLTLACAGNQAIDVQILSSDHGIVTASQYVSARKSTVGKIIKQLQPIFAAQFA
jgi:methionyl-tRNA formyltransferase